jgi:formate dehydrogenase subunit gamma
MSAPDAPARIPRFSRAERITHWVNAGLFFVCIATGAMFRFGIGQSLITDRGLARNIHVIAGFGILVTFVVGAVGRWGAPLRRDLGRFNRWSRDDKRWLRSFGGDRSVRLGKFNPGQKLNATFIGAAAVVLAATGAVMKWNQPFSTDIRTGSDFVHGWFALFVGLSVFGHIVMALRDREALAGMVGGTVDATWARDHRPRWFAETQAPAPAVEPGTPTPGGPVEVDA